MKNVKSSVVSKIDKKDAPISLFKSFLLFLIAAFLLLTTAPIGLLFALIRQIVYRKVKLLSVYLIEVALVFDQAGNVVMQHFLNFILLKKSKQVYLFGNKNETISSVIGKNSITNTLNIVGRVTDEFLNLIDNRHSLDSIIYNLKVIAAMEKEHK